MEIESLEKSKTPPVVEPSPSTSPEIAQTETGGSKETTDECTLLKGKLGKYKKGLIDFSYEDKDGQKVALPETEITKAYEQEIVRACADGGE